MKKVFVYFLATALVSSLTAFAVVKLTDKERGDYNENSATLPLRNVTLSDQLYPDFTFAAETAVKAVVHVKVTKKGWSNHSQFMISFLAMAIQVCRQGIRSIQVRELS